MTLPLAYGYTGGPLPVTGALTVSGAISTTDTTQSTSTTTGSGIFGGGVGIAKALFVGEGVNAASLTVAGSTVPTNGMYLPAANTVGLATNGVLRWSASTTAINSTLPALITIGAGSGATADAEASGLVLSAAGDNGVTLLAPNANTSTLAFGSPADSQGARIRWNSASDQFMVQSHNTGASLILGADLGITNLTLSGAAGSELATFVRNIVSTNGNLTLSAGDLIITTPTTPASASATGTIGTIAWDTGFLYVCTATDTWERVAIATW